MARGLSRKVVAAVGAVLLMFLGGCVSGNEEPSPPGESAVPWELRLSPADDGTTQQVLLGGKVFLELPSGSTWEYDEPADYPYPALASYCPPTSGSGGGSTQGAREVFEAVRTGTTTLSYKGSSDRASEDQQRFEITVNILDGPGAAPPSTQLAGVLLRAQDEGTTVHVPRNGVVRVELPGSATITNPEDVARASDGRLVAYCGPEPQELDNSATTQLKVTAVREGAADLVVSHDPDGDGPQDVAAFRATVVVDPVPGPSALPPTPSTSPPGTATSAPFVLELSDRDAGRTLDVLRGGKVIVTLPDPDGAEAGWTARGAVMGGPGDEQPLWWRCGGVTDSWVWASENTRRPVAEGPMVFEVGSILGTIDLSLVYVPAVEDEAAKGEAVQSEAVAGGAVEGEWSQRDVRDSFAVKLRIVDGPGATLSSHQVAGVAADAEDDGGNVEVARNGYVRVTLAGQHGLGRDWTLVSAGEAVRAFCLPRVFSEGPGPKDMSWLNEFTFTAMAAGVSQIELQYRDSADPQVVLDTYRLTVTVR